MELRKFLRQSTFAIALSVPVLITGCDKDDDPVNNTITDVVVGNASFTTLEAAVVKAGLQTTLSGTGPFTVFAPDDAAFTASGITSTVLNSLTPAQVSSILLYHTLGAKVTAADVPAGPNAKVTTASGDSVFVTKNANGVFINGIKVNTADVAADNGVIHVIGRVLNPPVGNIVETAVASGLDSLVKAVTRATTAPGGDPTLAGTLSTARLTNGSLPMLAGGNTTTNLTNGTGGGPSIQGNGNGGNRSNITATNIVCRNGVVHLIDRVLLP